MTARGDVFRAAALYAGTIFAAGFALGIIRTLWLAPALGPLLAVAVELPIILCLSWLVAARIAPPGALTATRQIAVGLLALAFLLGAELALSSILSGRAPRSFLRAMAEPSGLLGLAGQLVFALIPWLQGRMREAR